MSVVDCSGFRNCFDFGHFMFAEICRLNFHILDSGIL